MNPPNKIMQFLLNNTIRFNCDICKRHWLFAEYRVHKMRGACKKDPNADNSIEKLKGSGGAQAPRRQTVVSKPTGQAQQPEMQMSVGAAQTGHIYILERDTKFVYEYQLNTKMIFKRTVQIPASFQHNFMYCQTPSDKLFLIGGGEINKAPPSLK